jgi:hypothetical protein
MDRNGHVLIEKHANRSDKEDEPGYSSRTLNQNPIHFVT